MHLPRQFQLFVVCAVAAGLWCAHAGAAPIQPFEALVQGAPGEEVYARSGPGKERFYPTLKLTNGQRVKVLRKDPGGWFMIEPPEGSFSWFPAKYAERNGQQGTVIGKDPVVVRVGAFNSTQRDVEQVRLNGGDTIEILSEESLETEKSGRQVKEVWYRIKPPRNEYRWVKGSSLVELNPDGSPKVIASKQTAPAHSHVKSSEEPNLAVAKSTPKKGDSHTTASPVVPEKGPAPLVAHAPRSKPAEDESYSDLGSGVGLGTLGPAVDQATIRRELQTIGQKMRTIRELPESQWDMSAIEPELLALQQAATGTSMLPLVELRLRELRRDQLIQRNAVEMAMREQRPPSYTRMLPNRPNNQNGVQVDPRSGVFGTPPAVAPDPANGPGSAGSAVGFTPQPSPGSSRFQGAGIVARVRNPVPGVPPYVLIKPNGQLLCYLDGGTGLNLERYVGQQMGINGARGFDQQLRADRLRVQQLTPVRLAP
ncbi:MAG: hypothetical protein JWM11_3505 [Planctomycetaceae bacterium]|nr:hypothetical protein [Planctomycetaceae bacterium]